MSRQTRSLSARWRNALNEIAAGHGFTLERLQAPGKFKRLVAARKDCFAYLQAEGWSLAEIGGLFNRDHTTVLWSLYPDEKAARLRERQRLRFQGYRMGATA